MKILCKNCGYVIDTKDIPIHNIEVCPRCGTPYINDDIGIGWLS